VLVCDDGSTDNTKEIISSIGDARVKFIEGPRAGRPAVPRNRGLKQAKGEWIAFLDSDDAWLPGKLEAQLKMANQQNTKAVCSNAFRVLPGKDERKAYFENNRFASTLHLDSLIAGNFVICSSTVIEKSIVEKAGGFPEAPEFKAIEDYTLWLRIATLTSFAYCATPLVEYTDDPVNSVRTDNVTEKEQRERIFRNAWEWAKKENVAEKNQLKKAYGKALRQNGKFWQSLNIN